MFKLYGLVIIEWPITDVSLEGDFEVDLSSLLARAVVGRLSIILSCDPGLLILSCVLGLVPGREPARCDWLVKNWTF